MIHGKYVEVESTIKSKLNTKGIHFFYFFAGRGVGKTYGALDFLVRLVTGKTNLYDDEIEGKKKFLLLRNTAVEAQSIASEESNVFKTYNLNEGTNICADFNSKIQFGNYYNDNEKTEHIGYVASLSTFSNLRGVDFSDVSIILFDECVPEKRVRNVKHAGKLLLNALETINRNRVLEGKNEIVVIFLSNAIDLGNELLVELGFTTIINKMIIKNQEKITIPERSVYVQRWKNHPVSNEKKNKSALYKFARDTDFCEEATSGEFKANDLSCLSRPNLQEYEPYIVLDNIYFYKHKSKNLIHLCGIKMPCRYVYKSKDINYVKEQFGLRYKLMRNRSLITAESYEYLAVIDNMLGYSPYL